MTDRDPAELIDSEGSKLAMRQGAATVGGFLVGFVLGDAGLASNSFATLGLAVGTSLVAFSFVR